MIIQRETGTAARRYSQRDRRLGVVPLPESMFKFILFQECGRMAEITFVFSDEGYPFHAVKYNLQVVGPL